jgi:alpha/beta superfamily hydrolase
VRVTFHCGELALEGGLIDGSHCRSAAVVCHPHPQYGGDMHNPVVQAVCAALQQAGLATLCFNFRGVGASVGTFSGGAGEAEDARAAVRYLIQRSGASRVTLAGYSFGAMVALQAGAHMAEVDRLIAIAPPLAFFDLECLGGCGKEKLFVVGDRDQYCSVTALRQQLEGVAKPVSERVIAGADHFFFGHEEEIAAVVCSYVGR